MKTRLYTMYVFVIGFTLVLTGAGAAQGPGLTPTEGLTPTVEAPKPIIELQAQQNQAASATAETLTVAFTNGTAGVQTTRSYTGTVAVTISGVGQASGTARSDAFYVYTDYSGQPITPVHPIAFYNWTLWINGGPADNFVQPIPPYNPDHEYTFTISVSGGPLTFAVGDTRVGDNTGAYMVSITSDLSNPNDPLFWKQWGIQKIEILDAWSYTQGSSDIVIAVIDSGVDYTHVDLGSGKTLTDNDMDYVNDNDDAMDDNGHGTHVAGIIAANTNNGQGIAGICPQCRILPLKTLNAALRSFPADVASAIRYATDQGAKVINLSQGSDSCNPEEAEAVNYAYERNVVLVAAAGNACPVRVALGQETFTVAYPAQFERVIAVGATNLFDQRYIESKYGPELDISAPGEVAGGIVGILSTDLGGGYVRRDGTSFASPMAAGVAGLLLSQNPSLTPAQVKRILELSADDIGSPGWDKETGWGRLNARKALGTGVGVVPSLPKATCPTSSSSTTHSSEDELISLYIQLRDEVLLPSRVGQEYVKDYYRYGPELAAILLRDTDLRTRTSQFLEDAAPTFRSLLPNSTEEVALTQALYDEADGLVHDFANAGSAKFRDKILQTWEDMALDKHVGEPATEIWEQMHQNPVYLPIIFKGY